jgi:small subunit ribosomal protein S30e
MGKVHGSLARAGKVRGQTPKVAKQDKKKLPKGRAIKRLKVRRIPVTISRLRFYPASPGPSPIATLTTPVLLRDRQQYNRRFVNVVVGLGKKRSPNSNAT